MSLSVIRCKRCGNYENMKTCGWIGREAICEHCHDMWIEYGGLITWKEFVKRFKKRYPDGREYIYMRNI